jgi:hypothetical protein
MLSKYLVYRFFARKRFGFFDRCRRCSPAFYWFDLFLHPSFFLRSIDEAGISVKGRHKGYIRWEEITSYSTYYIVNQWPNSKRMILRGLDKDLEFQSDFIKNHDVLQSTIYLRIKDSVPKIEV